MRTKYIIEVDNGGWQKIFESDYQDLAENEFESILKSDEDRDFRILKQEILVIYRPGLNKL